MEKKLDDHSLPWMSVGGLWGNWRMSKHLETNTVPNQNGLRWAYGNREGYKTVEIFGFGKGEHNGAPPIGVFDLKKSQLIHKRVIQHFIDNPDAHIFSIFDVSDLGEPFFDTNGMVVKPFISVKAYGEDSFVGYISHLKRFDCPKKEFVYAEYEVYCC